MIVTMQKRVVISLLLSLFGLSFIIASAHAYEFPPYKGLSLKIEGKVTENYSNNITFAHDEENKKEQFTTLLVAGLVLERTNNRGSLRFAGQMRQPVRFETSDVRNSSEIGTLDFVSEISSYDKIRIKDVYTHTRVPGSIDARDFREECVRLFRDFGQEIARDDPRCAEFEREFGVTQGAFNTFRNDFNVDYSKDMSDRIRVSIGYGNNRFDSTAEGSNDSIRNNVNGRINYSINFATVFYLSYRYSVTYYNRGDDISIDAFRFGLKRYITKRLYFNGDIGMTFTPTSDNTSFDALLTGELDEKTNASIDFSRDTRAAIDREDIFINWRVTGRLTRQLKEDMNLFISAFYGEGDFVSAEVTDRLLGTSFSISYIFWQYKRGPSINGNIGYSYSQLDSTDASRGYDRNAIDATLSVIF
jgi:hypothetical protein